MKAGRPIVVQGALLSEIGFLLDEVKVRRRVRVGNCEFFECEYKNYPVVVSKTKIGEIASAMATTVAIQRYKPLLIINQGTAGALAYELDRGDIVVGEKIFYLSQFSTDEDEEMLAVSPWKTEEYRTLDGEVVSYAADRELIEILRGTKTLQSGNIIFGGIGSGDVWTRDSRIIEKYNRRYGVVCEAMECSGAYMTGNSFGTPVVSIRVVSNNELRGQKYEPETGIFAQEVTMKVLDEFLANDMRKLQKLQKKSKKVLAKK